MSGASVGSGQAVQADMQLQCDSLHAGRLTVLGFAPCCCQRPQACCWCPLQVASTSDEKLNQPLLQFHEESTADMPLLSVNFDPALVRLLRETRYFLLLRIEVSSAASIQCYEMCVLLRACCWASTALCRTAGVFSCLACNV
jgi:hypothetical protein